MAKGPQKNTKNKALHTKLMKQKKVKLLAEKQAKTQRLKELVKKINEQQAVSGENYKTKGC